MNKYMLELTNLKPWDEPQFIEKDKETGYYFITTAGHGYLVVPQIDKNAMVAQKICKYGFRGIEAVYLEEDCEYSEFVNSIKK